MLTKFLAILATPFFSVFGIMGGFIFYCLLFSILSIIYAIPAFFIISTKRILISKQHLFVPIYGYLIAFVLLVFSATAQSAVSFFGEMVIISIVGVIYIYLRIFLAWRFKPVNQKILSIICIIIFLLLVVLICFIMPIFPD